MAAVSNNSLLSSDFCVDKLTNEIFSILENKFLFGYDDISIPNNSVKLPLAEENLLPLHQPKSTKLSVSGKCAILSIDANGTTDGILAAKSLAHLEASLRRKSGNPKACIADYFDLVAGSGAGGVLAAMLFTRGKDGGHMFTAEQAVKFMVENRRKFSRPAAGSCVFRRMFRSEAKAGKVFGKAFGELTMKDTIKGVLIPCYDLTSGAPFVFSRADALETDGYDFKMRDVCAATAAALGAVEVVSVDRKTKITAVGGGVAMNNPTAAAITHVLNNKLEFPFCNGVEDLLVISLGNGESDSGAGNLTSSPATFVKIAGEGVSDMVDQAVSMAFVQHRTSNYVRIQGNGIVGKRQISMDKNINVLNIAEEMLRQKNVESILFQGKKLVENTNLDKLELFAGWLIKEQERRKTSILPYVILKQTITSPRTSSATTLSILSSN